MSTFSWELQQALVTLFASFSPPLVGGRVYDHVPENAVFPHVEIGEGQGVPADTTGDSGELSDAGVSEFVTFHVWSRYRGKKEVKETLSRLHSVLHEQSLTIPGRVSAHAFVRDMRVVLDQDGLTRHGMLDLEVIHRS